MSKDKKYVSASRVKTLENCSMLYWVKYHTDLPDKSNDGARRGSICHLILELLQEDKHKKHYDSIIKANDLEASPAIIRLIRKRMIIENMDDTLTDDNYELIKKMILVGLKQDFFCLENKGKLGKAEQEFLIENEDPHYVIKGYIDKHAFYDKGKTLKIIDYKSSKKKFSGDELSANGQAMMYVLAARTLWPKVKRKIFNFMFLKFPRQPIQELEFTDEQINGFEHYLASQYSLINNFTEENAKSNYAADNPKNSWLCAAGKIQPDGRQKWVCPQRDPYDYYVLLDENSRVLHSSKDKSDLKPKDGQKIQKKHHEGCPRWQGQKQETSEPEEYDPFDL